MSNPPDTDNIVHYSRFNSRAAEYAVIARKHTDSFSSGQKEIEKRKEELEKRKKEEIASGAPIHDESLQAEFYCENFDLGKANSESGAIAIIFAACATEASINDYGARRLGDSYFQNHLDKIDTLSKWIVIPKLATGNEFNKEGQAYQFLKALFRWRNDLMHPKSEPTNMDDLEEQVNRLVRKSEEFDQFVSQIDSGLDCLSFEAKKLDADDVGFWSNLMSPQKFKKEFPQPE